MFFCGQFGQSHGTLNSNGLKKIELRKGIYNNLFVENLTNVEQADIRLPSSSIPREWTKYTSIWSKFNGNLHCGNFDYSTDEVKSIIVKRRLKNNELDEWLPLFQIDIDGDEKNFDFNIYDRYVRANEEYDYILVPVLQQGTEGIMINATYPDEETKIKFDGLFIMNYYNSFSTPLDVEISTEKNKPTSLINPIGTKYPYVITTSENNYYTGNISATFLDSEIINGCREFKTSGNWKYREELNEFLQNGQPKIIKYQDGRMWLVSIYDNISEAADGHPEKITTSFTFVEIGDVNNVEDLWDNGLITYNPYNQILNSTNNVLPTTNLPNYSGTVYLDYNNDVIASGITVTLFNTTDNTTRTTVSDTGGDFEFHELEDGEYIVSGRFGSKSFVSNTISVINHIIDVNAEVNFVLK